MKKSKIISLIISLCITLNTTASAIEPCLEEEIHGIIELCAKQSKKDIPGSLKLFAACFDSFKDHFECDSIMFIAQYLVYYVYSLYPRSLSPTERTQLSSFFEYYSSQYGFPQYLNADFYSALDNVPAIYDMSEPIKFIRAYDEYLSNPQDIGCDQLGTLIKICTSFVYTLYALPLSDVDKLMLCRTYDKFKSFKPLQSDILALQKAIEHLPKTHE